MRAANRDEVQIRIAEERESCHYRQFGSNGTHRLLGIWSISTGILFCLCAAWSFATPIGAAQDEPAQLVKAASVVRGELVGPTLSLQSVARLPYDQRVSLAVCGATEGTNRCTRPYSVVMVPESFAHLVFPSCYGLSASTPAGCAPGLRGSGKEATAVTYVGRYPPLYYAIVGLPSLAWHTDVAVYLMRLLSGLMSAIFLGLALALAAVWSRSRFLVLAVAVTVTPMVVIFGSTVNPSDLECATAVCVWTGGVILILDQARHPPPSLIAATTAAATVMVLTRGLSPLWLAIMAVSLAAAAPHSIRSLIRRRSVRLAFEAVTLSGVVAVAYIYWAKALDVTPSKVIVPRGASQLNVVELALGRTGTFVQQLIGSIGWSEANPPSAILGLWMVVASVIIVVGLVTSQRRHVAVIVALVVASVVLPTALMVSQARDSGLVWQARDGFPLYAGILLMAGGMAGRNEALTASGSGLAEAAHWTTRRLAWLVAATIAVVQLGDFVWALRRYTVGLGSVVNPFARVPGGWSPPIPSIALVIAASIVISVYGWWIAHLHRVQDFAEPILRDLEMAMNVPGDGVVGTSQV